MTVSATSLYSSDFSTSNLSQHASLASEHVRVNSVEGLLSIQETLSKTIQTTVLPSTLEIACYKHMVALRCFDEQATKLQRSGRISFSVPSLGEEATHIGISAGFLSTDWLYPYYRNQGMLIQRGETFERLFANLFGSSEDIGGGRQMPNHYSSRKHRFVSYSSVIGTQVAHGVGAAMALALKQKESPASEKEIVGTFLGDGATSANDFHSGMTFASVYQAPVLIGCINNQYAISLPVEQQIGGATVMQKGVAYGIPALQVNGNDLHAVYASTKVATEYIRQGGGPILVEYLTYRRGPHTSSDDPSRYRKESDYTFWTDNDPIEQTSKSLISQGLWKEEQDKALWETTRQAVQQAARQASKVSLPVPESLFEDVYATRPYSLEQQRAWHLAHERNLTLTAHGEFPV
ncbi:MAG: thiamine pyrophosphate-dependent dehydrogenase E1 component subunit alpha [Vampirovibrionales bacterium]